jgi:hypothetical protein
MKKKQSTKKKTTAVAARKLVGRGETASSSSRKCGVCGKKGHNARSHVRAGEGRSLSRRNVPQSVR